MTEQTLDERQLQVALDAMSCVRVAQRMDSGFAAHAALFDGAVIDVLPGALANSLAGSSTQEQVGTVVAWFAGALLHPVGAKFLEQARAQWQDALLSIMESFP